MIYYDCNEKNKKGGCKMIKVYQYLPNIIESHYVIINTKDAWCEVFQIHDDLKTTSSCYHAKAHVKNVTKLIHHKHYHKHQNGNIIDGIVLHHFASQKTKQKKIVKQIIDEWMEMFVNVDLPEGNSLKAVKKKLISLLL